MSVFDQFVPYELETGTWDERRDEIADATPAAIARFAPSVAERQVLGPPDVEEQIGLTVATSSRGSACRPDVGPPLRAPGSASTACTSAVPAPTRVEA